jgi:hypothetical protein
LPDRDLHNRGLFPKELLLANADVLGAVTSLAKPFTDATPMCARNASFRLGSVELALARGALRHLAPSGQRA